MTVFVGVDWGGEKHAVCVLNDKAKVLAHFEVTHDAEGLSSLLKRLATIGAPADLAVAIEPPSGLLVDTLVAAGHPIVPIHPNAVKACRPRYRAAGGKNDLGDAYLLADVLRTDGHRFSRLAPQSDAIKALRALVRTRDDLVAERVSVTNRLRALLESYWAGATCIFSAIDSPIAIAFITRFPTPKSAASLNEKRLAAFLEQQRYSGRRTAAEVLARLRAAAPSVCSEIEAAAKAEAAKSLIRVLCTLQEQLASLSSRIEADVAQLPVGKIVMSFPRAGKINAAQIVAELGDVHARFQTEAQLAAEAGVCPVTHASGKSHGVRFRWACNHRLRVAITTWADNSRHASLWAADIYAKARGRGCDHPHAVRILARAWIRILWRAWTDRQHYAVEKHSRAAAFDKVA